MWAIKWAIFCLLVLVVLAFVDDTLANAKYDDRYKFDEDKGNS